MTRIIFTYLSFRLLGAYGERVESVDRLEDPAKILEIAIIAFIPK